MARKRISITVKTVPIQRQSYKTLGDYYYSPSKDNFTEDVYTTDLNNLDYSWLVAVHEIIESYLCYRRGLSDKEITKFDTTHIDLIEPGASNKAPYRQEHRLATKVERILAKELGIKWRKYDKRLIKELRKYQA